jgi:tetratricopeptide (TPR) repeat protein
MRALALLLLLTGCANVPLSVRADQARQRQDWPATAALYRELTTQNANDAEAWLWLALACMKLDRFDEAGPALERSIALKDSPQARYNLGLLRAMRGRTDQALPHFQRSVELDPNYGFGWYGLARAQAELGNLQAAAAAVLNAKRLRPDDPEVDQVAIEIAQNLSVTALPRAALILHARGGTLVQAGKHQEAEEAYREALRIAPTFADCHYNLGSLARRRGDLDAAEHEYRTAIAGYSQGDIRLLADARNNLADLLVARNKNIPEAVTLARQAIETRGARASYIDTLARACDANKDAECATSTFRKLLTFTELPAEVRAHAVERLKVLAP